MLLSERSQTLKGVKKMTAKQLVMQIIVDRVESLENEIRAIEETLDEKQRELERLTNFLISEDEDE